MSINTKLYIENYIKIRNKDSQIVPFILNEPQIRLYNIIKELHEKKKPIRIIILKARQMGFSTLTESIIFKNTATACNIKSGIITHIDTATKNLFEMSKLMLNKLPEPLKPELTNSNANELIFNNSDGTGLNSSIKCMTAGSKGVGRSATFNNLHISELAFWPGDKKSAMTGLLQTVPSNSNSMIIIESTANGYDYFKEMWDKAVKGENDFYPVFVAWHELKEYRKEYDGFELTEEEKEIKKIYKLDNEQLAWRRWCIENNCSGDIEQFHQEYPSCPQEAFITTGTCAFDKQQIINQLNRLQISKTKRYNFEYKLLEDRITLEDIDLVEDEKGCIEIYEDVQENVPYVLGGDTASEGDDASAAIVINNITGKIVAKLKIDKDEDLYSDQVYCLGLYYNTALIGLEINHSTYPTKLLEKREYPKLYVREKEDTIKGGIIFQHGFRTTTNNRNNIIAEFKKIFRETPENITIIELLEEMLVFVKNAKGKYEAMEGYHDDLVMSAAIAYHIRTQQSFSLDAKEDKRKVKVHPSLLEDYRNASPKIKKEMIEIYGDVF